ncbi:DUF362 domain-containing protein [Halothermothrix orenii]|uniref:Ferredoxin n=1 Tax=Halothermothrix orenii (strain H 168 / OCM 544 / DSM 9562) TaxID=373903 RepID=B8CZW3_HALOH|nr:DUF362 domain-containing protein [Halothermothrix orenii]ACL70815.1 4Fe-4S ferredoxin iron-sulfur binding domain protein [Halothermothrix orenii H 168]
MASQVYFASTRASGHNESLVEKLYKLFFKAGFHEFIEEDDLVAIKLHFGEKGNTGFIRPLYIRRIVEAIKSRKGKPFLTDANTLYVGSRANSVDHLNTAIANGFSYATIQAPLIIADGLTGKNFTEIPVNLKHFDKIKVGSEVMHADALITVSHFKGHELTGFGGTFKNIGMGLGSRSGKQMMHSDVLPEIDEEKCEKCRKCVKFCPENAITINKETSTIDQNLCIGCGECVVTCPTDAIKIQWESTSQGVQERIVEFSYGIIKEKKDKIGYINFVMNVTPDCDCASWSDKYIVDDIGILASKDPLALEQASFDLVNKQDGRHNTALKKNHKPGENKFKGVHPSTDGGVRTLEYAAELGLGSRDYELIEI